VVILHLGKQALTLILAALVTFLFMGMRESRVAKRNYLLLTSVLILAASMWVTNSA
jgi:hypothetical protein